MAAQRYAIIQAGTVVNVVQWDGDTTKWQPPAGTTAVALAANVVCAPGFTTADGGATFTFGQTTDQVNAQNAATINATITNALPRLAQIQTQAAAFQAQAAYATSNLANLNDLLVKSQLIAQAVNDLAGDMRLVARWISHQFDGTT